MQAARLLRLQASLLLHPAVVSLLLPAALMCMLACLPDAWEWDVHRRCLLPVQSKDALARAQGRLQEVPKTKGICLPF